MSVVMTHAAFAHAAERQVGLADMEQGVVDAYATGHHPVQQGLDGGFVVAERINGQWAGAGVDVLDGFFQLAVLNNRQDGAKNLALPKDRIFWRIEHDMGCHFSGGSIPGLAGDELYQGGAACLGFLQCGDEPVEGSFIDDGGQICRVQRRVAGLHNLFRHLDEFGRFALGQKEVVNRGADLPGVEALHKHQALRRLAQREVVTHDGGCLAAQLERHRAQVLRGGGHHGAPRGAGAGEQQVVKFEFGERDRSEERV